MKTEVKKLGANVVEVDIQIDEKKAIEEYDKAIRRLAQRVNIAGFRKGKAPKNIVEKYVGVESIQRDALEAMLPKVFTDVITEQKFELIAEPTLMSYDFAAGKPLKLKAKFELRPEVKISSYKGLSVKADEYKTEEGALEKELDRLSEKFAELTKVEGRSTTDKDIVMIDFEGSANGELIKGGAAKNYMLDLGNSTFIPGFAEQLIGKEAGNEFVINVKFPEEYHDEKLKGADAEFKITINEIKEKKMPEMNDELAKKVGSFDTLAALKEDIQKYLDGTVKAESEKRAYEAIFNKILENTEVEIHDEMVEREADAIIEDMKIRAQQRGQNIDEAIAKEGIDNVKAEMAKEALSRIKNSLIISKIAKDENIQVTAEDLEEKLGEVAQMYGVDKATMLKEMYKNVNLVQSLTQQIISEKVSKFILDNNTVKFK